MRYGHSFGPAVETQNYQGNRHNINGIFLILKWMGLSVPYPSYRVKRLRDSIGRTVVFDYDTAGDLISATNIANKSYQFQYGSNEKLTGITDPEGNQILSVTYYTENRIQSYAMGSYNSSLEYNTGLEVTNVTEVGGGVWQYWYDSNGITKADL
ncbi:MAG: RHS repeat domain-containing protein [Acidobacteriota bacterium]